MTLLWITIALVFAIVEVLTVSLVAGFVSLGALGAAIVAFVGDMIVFQSIVFAAVSILGIVVVRRPLVGHDRPGIMRDLSARLAERGVSIDELHTEIASAAMSAENLFKVKAVLVVPDTLSNDELRRGLEALANEMMVDIALGDEASPVRV